MKTKLQSPAVAIEGDLVQLPSHDEAPCCEADRWFYAVSHLVRIVVDGAGYLHGRATFVEYDKSKSLHAAQEFAATINAAGEVDLDLWYRIPSMEERMDEAYHMEMEERW
jgi:hypothetical protein